MEVLGKRGIERSLEMKFFGIIDCNRCDPELAELALAHPTSLNKALSALPFEANLNFYLKAR
jgi:hypothetical protein